MDELDQVKNKISIVDYVKSHTSGVQVKYIGDDKYRVNPCPKCGHKDHFTLYADTNSYSSFSECCEGGDILKYMQEVEGLNFKEAKEKLYSITNTPLKEFSTRATQEKPQKPQPKKEEKKPSKEELQQVSDFIEQGLKQMQEQDRAELVKYLNSRNISQKAIEKYNLFLAEDKTKRKRLYIPIYEQGQAVAFIGRAIDDNPQYRYMNSQGTIQPFNIDYLSREAEQDNEPLFICEGFFDAVSIEEQNKKAIALNSTSNADKFLEIVKKNKDKLKNYKFIIATDTDEARTRCKRENRKDTHRA